MIKISSYTSLKININTKENLTEQDIKLIKQKTEFNCGIDSYIIVEKNKIQLNVTFNYGFDMAVDLINTLEKYIDYNEVTCIGKFKTEDKPALNDMDILTYKNKIFMFNKDINYGFIQENNYYISDLKNYKQDYHTYMDKDIPDNYEELIIQSFLKEFYNFTFKETKTI